jgi:hypothetical protein
MPRAPHQPEVVIRQNLNHPLVRLVDQLHNSALPDVFGALCEGDERYMDAAHVKTRLDDVRAVLDEIERGVMVICEKRNTKKR